MKLNATSRDFLSCARTTATTLMAVLVLLGALLAAPAAASASWLPAVDLSDPGAHFDLPPRIAVDDTGGSLAVWIQEVNNQHALKAATKAPGDSFKPPITLASADAYKPEVAMNADGSAVVAWSRIGSQWSIRAVSRTPEGDWRPAKTISGAAGGSGFELDVAVDPAGRAVAVWTQGEYLVEAATMSPDGQWSPPVQLSKAGNNAWSPHVEIDPSTGRATAVWYRWNNAGDTIVQVAEKEPGEEWREPEDLSPEGENAYSPDIAVAGGHAVIAWVCNDAIEAATRDSDGKWQPTETISEPKAGEPSVGIDRNGDVLALWTIGPTKSGPRVAKSASLAPGGNWTEPVTLTERMAGDGGAPQIAVTPDGRAIALWTIWNGKSRVVEAASGGVGIPWGSPVLPAPVGGWSQSPQIAMTNTGDAAAVWIGDRIQAAVFDVSDPQLRSISLPATARAGLPVAIAADPFDAWSALTSVIWSFGDGAGAAGSSVAHAFNRPGQFDVTVTATDPAGHSVRSSRTLVVTPALAVAHRGVRVKGGMARLLLTCPGIAECHGAARLVLQKTKKLLMPRPRLIGSTQFALPGGAERIVTVRLRRKILSLIPTDPRKGFRANLAGSAVEPRPVMLKRAGVERTG